MTDYIVNHRCDRLVNPMVLSEDRPDTFRVTCAVSTHLGSLIQRYNAQCQVIQRGFVKVHPTWIVISVYMLRKVPW